MFDIKLDISSLSEKGKSFLLHSDKMALSKANKALDKINDDLSGVEPLDYHDSNLILKEYWSLTSNEIEFQNVYSFYKKRKKLISVFNNVYEGKRISSEGNLEQFLNLFENDTSELMTLRLCSLPVISWYYITKSKSRFSSLINYLHKKIMFHEKVKNKKLNLIKDNFHLIADINGPNKLAQFIVNRKITIQDGFKKVGLNLITDSFYSEEVISDTFVFLFKTKQWDRIEEIMSELDIFSSRLKKNIISIYTLEQNKINNSEKLKLVLLLAIKHIGDPSEIYKWSEVKENNIEENNRIEEARKILNKLLLAEFLDVFFTELLNEIDRRLYWLSKVELIEDIKIYGSLDTKRQLSRIDSIGEALEPRFVLTSGSSSSSGIIMNLKSSQILEFTDVGAIYCYNKEKNRISEREYFTLSDLRNREVMQMTASNSVVISREGRIMHIKTGLEIKNNKIIQKANWMKYMDNWLDRYE